MSNGNNGSWGALIRDIAALIFALTGLVTALGWGCHNSERLDRHREELNANGAAVEKNAERITKTQENLADLHKEVDLIP